MAKDVVVSERVTEIVEAAECEAVCFKVTFSLLDIHLSVLTMSASPVARQAVAHQAQPQSIPKRIQISSPADMPNDYSTTPGGTLFSTTPGGRALFKSINLMNSTPLLHFEGLTLAPQPLCIDC